ncbi:MAG: DUF2997 domain-containing protein [Armatimonadetes bacterium]|nr:DUF2997 domain-containing protein [Armatimonadota bacterium]
MAAKHEMEVEITPDGQVHVHVKGAKGKQCMRYVELFNSIGNIKEQQTTSEYYEPDPGVFITEQTKTRF